MAQSPGYNVSSFALNGASSGHPTTQPFTSGGLGYSGHYLSNQRPSLPGLGSIALTQASPMPPAQTHTVITESRVPGISVPKVTPMSTSEFEPTANDESDLEEGEVSEGTTAEQPNASSNKKHAQNSYGVNSHPARTQHPSPRMSSSNARGSGKAPAGPFQGPHNKRHAQGRPYSNWTQNTSRKQQNHATTLKDRISGDVSISRHRVLDAHPDQPANTSQLLSSDSKALRAGTTPWLSEQKIRAQEFIMMLHQSQETYHQLLSENIDQELLRKTLDELQLPVGNGRSRPVSREAPDAPSKRTSPPQTDRLQTPTNTSSASNVRSSAKSPPTASIHLAGNIQSKAVPVKPLALDQQSTVALTGEPKATVASTREEYSARLMAAKAKKSSLLAGNTTTRASSSPASTVSLAAIATTKPVSPQERSSPVSTHQATTAANNSSINEQKKKAQTDLIRLRMEALKSAKSQAKTQPLTEDQQAQDVKEIIDQSADSRDVSLPQRSGSKALDAEPLVLDPMIDDHTSSLNEQSKSPSIPPQKQTSASVGRPHQISASLSGRVPGLDFAPAILESSPNISESLQTPEVEQQGTFTLFESNQVHSKSRKRPVALDFMEGPLPEHLKRPFGQMKGNEEDEEIIIEVSDDDSESEQVSKPLNQARGVTSLLNSHFASRTANTGETNLSTSVSQRAQLSRQTSEIVVSKGGVKLATIQDQEARIAAMKQKILELERKKKFKSSQANTTISSDVDSLDGTPSRKETPMHSKPSLTEVREAKRGKHASSPVIDQGGQNYTKNETLVEADTRTATHARASSMPQSPHTMDKAEWKRRRQDEIRSGIPAFEAKAATNLSKMEALKQQMKQLEEEMEREQEAKEQLIRELRELGVETDGMPTEELQATKDAILSQQISAHDSDPEVPAHPHPSHEQEEIKSSSAYMSSADRSLSASPVSSSHRSSVKEVSAEEAQPPLQRVRDQNMGELPISITSSSVHTPEPIVVSPSASYVDAQLKNTPEVLNSGPESLSMVASEDEHTGADSNDNMDDVSSALEEGELDESEKEEQAVSTSIGHQQSVAAATVNKPEDVNMVDVTGTDAMQSPPPRPIYSNSDDANQTSTGIFRHQSKQGMHSEHKGRSSPYDATTSDDYEPPDTSRYTGNDAVAESDDDYEPPDAEISAFVTKPTLGEVDRQDTKGEQDRSDQTKFSSAALEPKSSIQASQQEAITEGQSSPKDHHLAPYSSPLKMFKAYRYHPDFTKDISNGFFSLTYSYNIDPNNPLCQYETAGGVCNDPQCEDQHFRSMAVAGDAVLTQLGMDNPGQSREEKIAWNEGLKKVLHELAARNTRDVQVVAAAIVDYRREFLNDPSNILNLRLTSEA